METNQCNQPKRNVPKKLLILFVSFYMLFYIFPFPFELIPYLKNVIVYYLNATEFITLWIGHNALNINTLRKIAATGSGDTTFDYVKIITNLVLSVLFSLSVALFITNQNFYSKLHNGTIIYARYFLGFTMLSYGFVKVYGGQFMFPDVVQLEKTYGNSSPMNLLWTFMGYSKPYTVFSGTVEIVGGFLLLFRRTTVLGCLVTIAIMINIVMLNFSYDVPVKLFSSHLLLFAFFIVSPHVKKLVDFFILNKATALSFEKIQYKAKWMQVTRLVLKFVIVIGIPLFSIIEVKQALDSIAKEGQADERKLLEKYPLVSRGFHWINEYPYNR
ncbi:hypothetical protein BH11BAC5_BH11BAC5_48850 [soil metagenome]